MLSLATSHYATNVPGPYGRPTNYVLYPDTDPDKATTYYVLPETPTFAPMPGGNPSFNMLWWFGSGETEGGMWTFTVALPLPDLTVAGVRERLTEAVNDDMNVREHAQNVFELAKAYAATDAVAIAKWLKALDIKDDEGRALTHSFDANKGPEQFRPPTKKNLKFEGVRLKSGTVTVRGFKSARDVSNPTSVEFDGTQTTTPSLELDNAAVITFNLNRLNSILVWQAMGGPPFSRVDGSPEKSEYANSAVTVMYAVEFDGMLPAAEAIVTLKKTSVAQVLTKEKSSYSSWSGKRTWDEVVGKDYSNVVRDAIEVRTPSSDYMVAPAGTKSVKELLTDWAAAQLTDMLSRQLPDIKLSDLMTDKPDKINQVQDQTRTYKLSTAIAITRRPQAQLPKVNGLVPAAALKDYFSTIDLSQVPYFPATVVVNPVARATMAASKINSIVLTRVNFGAERLRDKTDQKQEVTTVPFVAEGSGVIPQKELVGLFGKASENNVVSYDYSVSYSDGTPTYRVENVALRPKQFVVDLGAADLGVLRATLDGSWLPWGIVSSAKVEVKYADLYQDTFLLTKEVPKVEIAKPLGRKVDQKLQYRLTLNLSSGGPLSYPAAADTYAEHNLAAAGAVPLRSPLGDAGTTELTFRMGRGVSSASARVEYAMPLPNGTSRRFSKLIQLETGTKATDTWTVATPPEGNPKFTFKRSTVVNGQGELSLPEQTEEADSSDPQFVFGLQKVDMR